MKRSPSSNSPAAKDREAEIQQILAILHKWGIHTLGQFATLDKEQLGARLGPEAVRMWERANGQSDRPLRLIRPPESFEESFEFENEIETAEPVLFMLRRFLEQLALRLSGIYFVAKELTLRITFTNKQQYERCFDITQPESIIRNTRAFDCIARRRSRWHACFGRNTQAGRISHRAIFVAFLQSTNCRGRRPRRLSFRCGKDTAHYNCVATISTCRICIRFSVRKYSRSSSQREPIRLSLRAG